MKSIFAAILLFTSLAAQAGTWELKCAGRGFNGLTDVFKAILNSDKKLVSIDTSSDKYPFVAYSTGTSTDLGAVDPGFFEADFSSKVVVVSAEVTTYNYFTGKLTFFLGRGLEALTKDVKFTIGGDNSVQTKIAVEYYDGDGFGFDKRNYDCAVTQY